MIGISNHVTVSDGVRLHYLRAGSGKPLVMIPGWSQTAAQFKYQFEGLHDLYRLIALDMRGHGESDKPNFGYKTARLAKDLHDVLVALDLNDITLLGHSLGCAVIWCYWDLFGTARLSKLVFVDQPPCVTANPAWSPKEREDAGTLFTPESLYATCTALAGPNGVEITKGFVNEMTSSTMPYEEKAWIIEQNLRLPRIHAAALLCNHAPQDWRDVIARITCPTLVISGRVSNIPWTSQVWIHQHVAGSNLEIFEAHEGGSHLMFMEGAKKFNRILAGFLG